MRFFTIGLLLFLVSCASPQKNPESFSGNVYTPGSVMVEENGAFVSTASVAGEDNQHLAEKAAYGRLLGAANSGGYKYLSITSENSSKAFAYNFTLKGKLYKKWVSGVEIFPVSSIAKIIGGNGYVAKQKKLVKKKAASPKVVKQKVVDLPKPQAPQKVQGGGDDPLVILAPTDITGSIKKDSNGFVNVPTDDILLETSTNTDYDRIHVPAALRGTPLGVLIKRN